jgi:glycosyltransferase involved in cell wall biosynthesis
MRQMGMHNPLLVNAFQPFLGVHLYQSLGMHKTIYYCYDEMAEARWLGRHGSYMEAEMMRLADLVISSSEALEMRKKQYCRASTTVTNGVDFNSFYNARMNEPKRQQKATIGYTGSIDERFDTGLMAEVIAQLPGLEFRFVGRVSNEKARQRLKGFPNVTFLGAVAPDEVPQLMGQMDVGIIPYLENELTRYVYPLKINEFLAMGLPVVMTPFADLPEFRGLVYQAAAAEEFARCLLQALAEENTQLTERRFRHAASRSWEHQAEKFHAALSGLHVSKYQQEVV